MQCPCEVLFPSSAERQPATLTDEHPNALGRPVVDLGDGEPYGPDGVASIRISSLFDCPLELFDLAVNAGFHILGTPGKPKRKVSLLPIDVGFDPRVTGTAVNIFGVDAVEYAMLDGSRKVAAGTAEAIAKELERAGFKVECRERKEPPTTRLFIYNENCVSSGRSVPQRIIDEHPDPENGGDWTMYDGTEAELVNLARTRFLHAPKGAAGQYDRKVARTLADAFGVDLDAD